MAKEVQIPLTSSNSPGDVSGKKWHDVAIDGLKHSYNLARISLRNAPPGLKAGIWSMFALETITILVVIVPPYEQLKQLVCLGFGGIFFLAVLTMFRKAVGELPGPNKPAGIQLPDLKSSVIQQGLRAILQNAREAVLAKLQRDFPEVKDRDVRANIFLPDDGHTNGRTTKRLRIPHLLCVNMDNPEERSISFESGKGGTGQAFTYGKPLIIQREPEKQFGWDERYEISGDQARVIHPDLTWIVSMPIVIRGKNVVGVMNIDILRHRLDYDRVVGCSLTASAFVMLMSEYIAGGTQT